MPDGQIALLYGRNLDHWWPQRTRRCGPLAAYHQSSYGDQQQNRTASGNQKIALRLHSSAPCGLQLLALGPKGVTRCTECKIPLRLQRFNLIIPVNLNNTVVKRYPVYLGAVFAGAYCRPRPRLQQTRERLDSLRAQVDADVRSALLNLQSSTKFVSFIVSFSYRLRARNLRLMSGACIRRRANSCHTHQGCQSGLAGSASLKTRPLRPSSICLPFEISRPICR